MSQISTEAVIALMTAFGDPNDPEQRKALAELTKQLAEEKAAMTKEQTG